MLVSRSQAASSVKRVALRSYQTTLPVLAKGDLQHEYGVVLDQVTWVTSADEPVAFQPPDGVNIQRAPLDKNIENMPVEGEVEAYFVPRMPRPFINGSPERLTRNPAAVR